MALLSTIFDILSAIAIYYTQAVPVWINYFLAAMYFMLFKTVTFVYFVYMLTIIIRNHRLKKWEIVVCTFPFFVEETLILTTYWTGFIYSFDANKMFVHGPLLFVIHLTSFIYIVLALGCTIKYRNRLTTIQRGAVYFYTVAILGSMIFQNLNRNYLVMEFATALSLLLIYLSLENPENYEDKILGTLNHLAFTEILSVYFEKNTPFEILGIQIQGMQYVSETFGVEQSAGIMKKISEYLAARDKHLKLFYISKREFALVGSLPKEHWNVIIKDIRERFKYPFTYNDMNANISGLFCMTAYPENVGTMKDLFDTINYGFVEAKKLGGDITVFASTALVAEGRREYQILQILKQALLEERFEVYYQPIYSSSKKRYKCAEALIRLKDEKFGYISPEEFIPIAEKNGLILDIGELVFRKVCEFMSRERIWEKGIRYVDVNLSVVQCMQKDLHKTLLAIMDEYHLEYQYIAFEVTETVAVVSSDMLHSNMRALLDKGIHVSLDDYGTGFSNTASLIQFPFTAIKIDKSMLWTAMESPKAMSALKHIIAMIIDMDMAVIAEGVETQEQADLLTEWGCHLHQGYFYSKPLCEELFLEKIK